MPHLKPKGKIPLYSADNELQDWLTPQRAARLESLGIVRVVRHKKGHVNRCTMRWRSGDPRPSKISDYVGKPYSFRERLESGHVVWALRKLNVTELDLVLLQVVRECARNDAQMAHVGLEK